MRLAFLSIGSSVHTKRWVNAMVSLGHEVHLISMQKPLDSISSEVKVHLLPFGAPIGYVLNVFHLKRLLRKITPDILSVHRASGYGTLAQLCGFHPRVISVWGNDVYEFPDRSIVNRWLIKKNLLSSDAVCSTSEVMANRVRLLYPELRNLYVVPFGIDIKIFYPNPILRDQNKITIGTVKTLAPKYGIDVLVRAFAEVKETCENSFPEIAYKLRLLIVGGEPNYSRTEKIINRIGIFKNFVQYSSSEMETLKALVEQLGIGNVTTITGAIPHDDVPSYLNQMDIYVAASRFNSESFGVAVIEASACGLPVVVSDVGGLPEVVDDGKTGFVLPSENVSAFSNTLYRIIQDETLRNHLGYTGRNHVADKFNWDESIKQMEKIYCHVLEGTIS